MKWLNNLYYFLKVRQNVSQSKMYSYTEQKYKNFEIKVTFSTPIYVYMLHS